MTDRTILARNIALARRLMAAAPTDPLNCYTSPETTGNDTAKFAFRDEIGTWYHVTVTSEDTPDATVGGRLSRNRGWC